MEKNKGDDNMKTLNPQEIGYSLKNEEYQEYLSLKEEEKKRLKKAKEDYHNFHIDLPEGVLSSVPETKQDEVKDNAKLEIIGLRMTEAQQKIVRANHHLKAQEIAKLTVDYNNMCRQLTFNVTRLKAIRSGQVVKDREDKLVYSWELEYLIDKISTDLRFVIKELKFLGVDVVNPVEMQQS